MFFDSLDKVKRGLCVCVFDGIDRIQHTFWREIDPLHPAHKRRQPGHNHNAIERTYQRMDDVVGRALASCESKDAVLMVISDHGFGSFRYGIDLNRWLEKNGYLKLEDGQDKRDMTTVDWTQTRAFALGLGGIFLNLKGREAHGIVDPDQGASQLREEIAAKLADLTDSANDDQCVVKRVYIAEDIYSGPYTDDAPDLIVGFNSGYRASWGTAIGQISDKIIEENSRAWSGDHCIDPSLVPGVLFCNRKIKTEKPRLMDIGPTVLRMFGVEVPGYMDGQPLAVANAESC
jgi:predicted AlkP superfamily phosphohydrolase/phosphomutase